MIPSAEPLDEAVVPAPAVLLERDATHLEVAVHDASRLSWHVTVPIPEADRRRYSFELELEVPANLFGITDLWTGLQSYARLDGADDGTAGTRTTGTRTLDSFQRAVVLVSSKLGRARDGFVRHCTLIRSSTVIEENQWRPLKLWVEAASCELANARSGLLENAEPTEERALADEFLSGQMWTALTDCGRGLIDARRALEARGRPEAQGFDAIEALLASVLKDEMTYRHRSSFPLAEPASTAQLERLLARMRWLKKHFERVLFLDVESYQVINRFSGWFSAIIAMFAYLWFLFWQLALERHPAAIGSGVIAFALLTALLYASRERLKEVGRSWLAGRVQRIFAQRVKHYRLPRKERKRGAAIVVSARESFSQSSARAPDPVRPDYESTHDITLVRFVHRGFVTKLPAVSGLSAQQVRLIYRLDLSSLFPRLHDAVRGFASIDERTGRLEIVDVPRNYELPLRASMRWHEGDEKIARMVVMNKNGLLRVDLRQP